MSLFLAAGAPSPEAHIQRHHLFDTAISNHMLMAVVAISLGIVIMFLVAKTMQPRESEGAKGYVNKSRLGGFFEMILLYLRDEAVRPLLHDKTDKYIGLLWSIFFFVLFGNLLGMVPIGPTLGLLDQDLSHVCGTFTGNWNFTIALSGLSCLMWIVIGLRENGFGYIKHFWVVPLKGQHPVLWILLIPIGILVGAIEILSHWLITPFALSVRLLANMMAGHLVLGSILLMSVVAFDAGNYMGAGVSFLGAIAISFLELFVAFLQAYVFMFLTAIFISLGLPHDDHGHEGEHAH